MRRAADGAGASEGALQPALGRMGAQPRADARGGAAVAGARSLGGEHRRPWWWAGQGQGWVLCVYRAEDRVDQKKKKKWRLIGGSSDSPVYNSVKRALSRPSQSLSISQTNKK